MNTRAILLVFCAVLSGKAIALLDEPIQIVLVNDIFDTRLEAFNQKNALDNLFRYDIYPPPINDPLAPTGNSVEFFTQPQFNIGGRGEGTFNDVFAEWLASDSLSLSESQALDTILAEQYPGVAASDIEEALDASERRKLQMSILTSAASRTPLSLPAELLSAFVGFASDVEGWGGDTSTHIANQSSALNNDGCVVMAVVGEGLGMAARIIANLATVQPTGTRSRRGRIFIVDMGDSIGREDSPSLLEAVDAAKKECGFRIERIQHPSSVVNSNPNFGTTVDHDIYWNGLPDLPVRMHISLDPDCRSFDCSVVGQFGDFFIEGNTATYNDYFNPYYYEGTCFGNTALFGGLIPNSTVQISEYLFFEDARGVTTNSVYVAWDCTYVP